MNISDAKNVADQQPKTGTNYRAETALWEIHRKHPHTHDQPLPFGPYPAEAKQEWLEAVKTLMQLHKYGYPNKPPIFVSNSTEITGDPQNIGSTGWAPPEPFKISDGTYTTGYIFKQYLPEGGF